MNGDLRKKARLKDNKKVKCIKKYCWDLIQYMSFFIGKKLKDIKCGFKSNRDHRKHGRMHEL